jgi:hypothetical protein
MSTQRKNVYQMILDAEIALDAGLDDSPDRYPLFIRRAKWEHPKAAFLVLDTYPEVREWSQLQEPYFNGPGWAKVQVYGIAHHGREDRYSLEWLSCPGTYGYSRIARPEWWNPPDVRCRLDARLADRQRWPGDFWIECSLREGDYDDDEDEFAREAQRIFVPGVTGSA